MTAAGATATTPGGYFASLGDCCALAVRRCGEVAFDLAVGPGRLRVSFAGSALADAMMGPLRRLVAAPDSPMTALIQVWDSAASDTPRPALPPPHGGAPGEAPRFRSVYAQEGKRLDSLAMFDARERVGRFWFPDRRRIRWYERAEPLRTAIHWALTSPETFLAHASAVGDQRGAIVLTGRGGSGKTTTTLASLESELQFVGDNYVLISLSEPAPTVHGLFGTAKLWPPTLEQLPWLAPMLIDDLAAAADEKLVVDIARHRPNQLAASLPVRAVVVPHVGASGPARVTPCSPGRALLAMAPATMLQLPRTDRGLAGMAELVRRVPTYSLQLGAEVSDGPRVLSELLAELTR